VSASAQLVEAAGSCLMIGFAGREPGQTLLDAIARRRIAGVILFSRNLGAPAEVAELARRLHDSTASGPRLLLGIDQEGGRVQRLRDPLAVWPPMRELGIADDVALTERVGAALGEDLHRLGFNLDFAPVLDVVSSTENAVIGDRSFGPDPELVARHGLALARGLSRAGLIPCGKHFPGHGGPVSDSHHTLPVERRSLDELRACDLRPFVAAIRAGWPLLMSAHVVYTAIDGTQPGTLSPAIGTRLLRDELRFEGVLISDDMEMAAVAAGAEPGEAALRALRAGIDLLLFCHREDRQQAAVEALVRAAEASTEDRDRLLRAAARVGALRAQVPAPVMGGDVDAGRHAPLLAALSSRKSRSIPVS
jgi:beta-N-acetylhexosaminidase